MIADDNPSTSTHLSTIEVGSATDFDPVRTAALLQKIWSLRAENPVLDFSELGEVPWNILLELMASTSNEKSVSVTKLAILYDMPVSITARYVDYLYGLGLIDKRENEQNPADIKLTLSEFGQNAVSKTLARIADQLNMATR